MIISNKSVKRGLMGINKDCFNKKNIEETGEDLSESSLDDDFDLRDEIIENA